MANDYLDHFDLNGIEVQIQDYGRDQPNGVPELDENAKLPLRYLPQGYAASLKTSPEDPFNMDLTDWATRIGSLYSSLNTPAFSEVTTNYIDTPEGVSASYGSLTGCKYKGVYIVVLLGPGPLWSEDLVNWHYASSELATLNQSSTGAFVLGEFKGRLFLGYNYGSTINKVYSTNDGKSWTLVSSSASQLSIGEDSMVIFPAEGQVAYISTDGENFDPLPSLPGSLKFTNRFATLEYLNGSPVMLVYVGNSILLAKYKEDSWVTTSIGSFAASKLYAVKNGVAVIVVTVPNSRENVYISEDGESVSLVHETTNSSGISSPVAPPLYKKGLWFKSQGGSNNVALVSLDNAHTWQALPAGAIYNCADKELGYCVDRWVLSKLTITKELVVTAVSNPGQYGVVDFGDNLLMISKTTTTLSPLSKLGEEIWVPPVE